MMGFEFCFGKIRPAGARPPHPRNIFAKMMGASVSWRNVVREVLNLPLREPVCGFVFVPALLLMFVGAMSLSSSTFQVVLLCFALVCGWLGGASQWLLQEWSLRTYPSEKWHGVRNVRNRAREHVEVRKLLALNVLSARGFVMSIFVLFGVEASLQAFGEEVRAFNSFELELDRQGQNDA